MRKQKFRGDQPKQRMQPILAFECKLGRSYTIVPCSFNSHNRFLESLEDSALMYSIERFMKGELDRIKLFIEVRLSYFIVCYHKSTDYY